MSSLAVQRAGWQGTNGLPVGVSGEPGTPASLTPESEQSCRGTQGLSINSACISCSASRSPLPSPLLCLWVFDFLFENSSSRCHCRSPSPVTSEGCLEPVSQRPALVFIKGGRNII